jgi:multidrug efflux system membrane fusion protein
MIRSAFAVRSFELHAMIRRRRLFLAALLCTTAAAWLILIDRPSHGVSAGAPAPRAKVAAAVLRDLPIYLYTLGTVEASKTVTIRPRVDGTILRVLFREGDMVQGNAPLFEIDPTLYRSQTDQADATLAKDQATLERARNDLKRLEELADRALVPRQSLDQQRTTVAELEATIKGDQAALEAARAQLDWTTIRSPIAGRVGHRLVDAGNLVHAASDTALVDIVQMNPIKLIFSIPQEKLPQLKSRLQGSTLPLEIRYNDDWLPVQQDEPLLLYNTIDRTTSSITLRALVNNRDARLWPGAAIDVRITVEVRKDIVSVPEQAVFEAMAGPAVYVVDATRHVVLRRIKPLGTSGTSMGVESGLQANERVIVSDQERFAPGIEVVPEVASP